MPCFEIPTRSFPLFTAQLRGVSSLEETNLRTDKQLAEQQRTRRRLSETDALVFSTIQFIRATCRFFPHAMQTCRKIRAAPGAALVVLSPPPFLAFLPPLLFCLRSILFRSTTPIPLPDPVAARMFARFSIRRRDNESLYRQWLLPRVALNRGRYGRFSPLFFPPASPHLLLVI